MADNRNNDGGDATLVSPPSETDLEILKSHLQPKYSVEKKLGSGGMADVYLGFHNQLKRKVAIKVLPRMFGRDEGMVQRFMQEAESAAQLEHPNIISIYDIGVAGPLNYFIMAFVPGGSLKDRLRRDHTLDTDSACRIIIQMCNALGYAHTKGVIHRDIKPDNIMFDEHHNAILTDFGIAKAKFASRMTATGTLVGTPHYMSPEQLKGAEIDGRSDIYSLGIMFYEILTGHVPFEGEDTYSVGLKHIQEPPIPPLEVNKAIPLPINNIILTMLAKTPEARFQSAIDVAKAIITVQQGGSFEQISAQAKAAIDTWRADKSQIEHDFERMKETMGTVARPGSATQTGIGVAPTQVRREEKAGPPPPSPRPAARKGGSPMPLIIGLVVIVAIIVGAVVLLPMLQGGGGSPLVTPGNTDNGGQKPQADSSAGMSLNGLIFVARDGKKLSGTAIKADGSRETLFPERPEVLADAVALAWNDRIQRYLVEQSDGSLITVNAYGFEDSMIWQEERGQAAGPKMASWSEDGSRVAFVRLDNNQSQLVIAQINDIGMAESSAVVLTRDNPMLWPVFLPGKRDQLYFGLNNPDSQIYFYDLSAEPKSSISVNGALLGLVSGPESRIVACLIENNSRNAIVIYDLALSSMIWESSGDPEADIIFSGPDHRTLLFTNDSGGKTSVWSVPFTGGRPHLSGDLAAEGLVLPAGWARQ